MSDDVELVPGEMKFKASEVLPLIDASIAAPKWRVSYDQAYDPSYALPTLACDRLEVDATGSLIQPLKEDEVDQGKLGPAIWLVKDRGCYLMSNATDQPRDPITGSMPAAYAMGLGPDADYDDLRFVCGGENFCESIELDEPVIRALRNSPDHGVLKVRLTEETLEVMVIDAPPLRAPSAPRMRA